MLFKMANLIVLSCRVFLSRNKIILDDIRLPAKKDEVNVHFFSLNCEGGVQNLGDYLSNVVVEYMKKYCNVCCNTKRTKHLYAIGSILQIGFQDATVWGTGFIDDEMSSLKRIIFAKFRKLDVRAVRGPLTRKVLVGMGVSCPEIYGDPAILMPLIYKPKVSTKKKEFVFVAHMHDNTECDNKINILTTDFKKFIDELVLSERVISSSLHGIILAESYGIPAVLYCPENFSNSLFKYCDYYLGTGREKFPIARSISEALTVVPAQLPDLSELQAGLIATFPKDLWEE